MKWKLVISAALVGCLLAVPALAAPSVKLSGSTFTIKEALNDEIVAQIKADEGKVRNKAELGFTADEISNEDLARLCSLYPAMNALTVKSRKVDNLAPLAGLTGLKRLTLTVQATDLSPLKGLTGLTNMEVDSPMTPDLAWMSNLKALTRVSLRGKGPLSLVGLPSLPKLGSIAVRNVTIADLTPLVEALPGLTNVDLMSSTIADLSPLCKLAKLNYLNLYGCTVKDFSPLAGCATLKKIIYYATKDADYSTLGKLTQVTDMDGGLTKMDNIGWVANLPNLRTFDVFAEYVTDYSPLSKTRVEQFQVWNMRVPVGDMAAIGQTVSLKKLTLWDVEGASNSKSLAGLVNLEEVVIRGYNAKKGGEPFDMNAAAKWSKVSKATFENASFINSDGLSGMTAVRDLRIQKANLKADTPLSLAFLGKLSALKSLTIDESKVSNPEALAQCTGLTHVRIVKTEGMTSLAPLQKLPNLKQVTVSKGKFPEAELTGFAQGVKVVQN